MTSTDPLGRGFRRFLWVVFTLGVVGTLAELALLEHTESLSQWIPLVLLAGVLVVLAVHLARPGPSTITAVRAAAAACVAAGLVGIVQHYRGNAAFELEMQPGLEGADLIWRTLTGATPALAPGTMIWLGLLGLAATYRHPARTGRAAPVPSEPRPAGDLP